MVPSWCCIQRHSTRSAAVPINNLLSYSNRRLRYQAAQLQQFQAFVSYELAGSLSPLPKSTTHSAYFHPPDTSETELDSLKLQCGDFCKMFETIILFWVLLHTNTNSYSASTSCRFGLAKTEGEMLLSVRIFHEYIISCLQRTILPHAPSNDFVSWYTV